jgi:hypothetical protein
VSREKERYTIGAEAVLICYTTHDRTPFIRNVGNADLLLDIKKWPTDQGLTLAPGVTLPFPNPMTQYDATPIFAVCPGGTGEVEYLFLR